MQIGRPPPSGPPAGYNKPPARSGHGEGIQLPWFLRSPHSEIPSRVKKTGGKIPTSLAGVHENHKAAPMYNAAPRRIPMRFPSLFSIKSWKCGVPSSVPPLCPSAQTVWAAKYTRSSGVGNVRVRHNLARCFLHHPGKQAFRNPLGKKQIPDCKQVRPSSAVCLMGVGARQSMASARSMACASFIGLGPKAPTRL